MKKILYLATLLPLLAMAQTGNYVKNTVYKIATTTTIPDPSITQAAVQVTYFDGLGRPIQQRALRQANTGDDIVTHMEYDNLGRQYREYLPYPAGTSPDYDPDAKSGVMAYYAGTNIPATAYPYSEKKLEESPFNRVLAQYAPGEAWANPSDTGNDDHGVRFDYLTNADNEVLMFKATAGITKGNYNITLVNTTNCYPARELGKTVTRNENWTSGTDNTIEEFKDKEGRVVLKRTYGKSIINGVETSMPHDTYYVYDQYSNLTFVLPPLVNTAERVTPAILSDLCYQYKYDNRNRLVEKKAPGASWEFIVYDQLDRIIATGPARSPFSDLDNSGWLITKYDVFSRPILTGWMPSENTISSAQRKILQDAMNLVTSGFSESRASSGSTVGPVTFGYTNTAEPTTGYQVLTVNYYDDYGFAGMPALPPTVEGQPVYYNETQKPRGLATGSWTRILQASTNGDGSLSYILYDKKARVIHTATANHLTGYTEADSRRDDFSGKLLYTITRHRRTSNDPEIVIEDRYTYTDQDRPLMHTQKINNDPLQMLSLNEYDAMGRLVSKRVGSNPQAYTEDGLQKIDYSYTIRGWLSGINKTEDDSNLLPLKQDNDPEDLFALKINYDQTQDGIPGIDPLYNGNIAETYWRTADDNILRKYSYRYDAMNRLREAAYQKPGSTTASANCYNESMDYDKNGNIASLKRNGEFDDANVSSLPMKTDDLVYTYDAAQKNRLLAVDDTTNNPNGFNDGNPGSTDYAYDEYGNMVKDLNKGIGTAETNGINYNHLRLPVKITFANGNTIEYLYDAAGQKLKKTVTEGTVVSTTDYLGGFVYFNGVLKFFPTSEGYVNNTVVNGENVYNYAYNYTDHLGNVRLSYGLDPATGVLRILEENNYYPFGLKHRNYNMSEKNYLKDGGGVGILPPCEECPRTYKYNYKYNGKELQSELGLNMYDMDARDYDPAIGRWTGIDPITHHSTSPYSAMENNPAYWADPSGADVTVGANAYTFTGQDAQNLFGLIHYLTNPNGSGGEDEVYTAQFTPYVELPELIINRKNYYSVGMSGSGLAEGIQYQAYANSPFYQYVRDGWHQATLNDFQSSVGWLGVIDPTGVVDGLNSLGYLARGQYGNAAISAVAIIPFGDFAKGIKYTKSSLKLGQEMHRAYKVGEEVADVAMKEFRGIKGIRPDFVDFSTKTIYELKPFNPRAMQAGERQLAKYKAAFEMEYPGTIWSTVLDTY